jgi:hypothetical protein
LKIVNLPLKVFEKSLILVEEKMQERWELRADVMQEPYVVEVQQMFCRNISCHAGKADITQEDCMLLRNSRCFAETSDVMQESRHHAGIPYVHEEQQVFCRNITCHAGKQTSCRNTVCC